MLRRRGRQTTVPVHGSRGRKKGRLEAVAACCAPWALSSLLFFCIPPRPHRARKGGRGLRQKQKSFGKRDAARHASSNSAEVADGASEWRKKGVRCVGLFPLPAGKRGIARKLASFIHLPPPSHVCKDSGWLGGRREGGKGGRGSRMLLLMRDMQHCRRKRRGRKKGGALAGRERERWLCSGSQKGFSSEAGSSCEGRRETKNEGGSPSSSPSPLPPAFRSLRMGAGEGGSGAAVRAALLCQYHPRKKEEGVFAGLLACPPPPALCADELVWDGGGRKGEEGFKCVMACSTPRESRVAGKNGGREGGADLWWGKKKRGRGTHSHYS